MRGLGRKNANNAADVQTQRSFLQELDGVDFLRARPLTVTVQTGVQFAIAKHGLGRAYTGGIIVGVSYANAGSVATPDYAQSIGIDVSKLVLVWLANVATRDTTVDLRVF